jgi:hypothetical protein
MLKTLLFLFLPFIMISQENIIVPDFIIMTSIVDNQNMLVYISEATEVIITTASLLDPQQMISTSMTIEFSHNETNDETLLVPVFHSAVGPFKLLYDKKLKSFEMISIGNNVYRIETYWYTE